MNKTSSAIVRTLLLGTSCLSMLGLGAAHADPSGGTVVTGSATIANRGPNSTVINQTTNKALINWQSFSIAAGGTVQFNQPSSSSIAVNRVIGSTPSSIFGNLLANGQVWIINGNGILFGKGSQVNVGGLIATTSDISNADFANGNYNFSGGTGASVANQGTIRTRNGGAAILSGASVSNQGLIAANTGTVVLGGASAFTVDFDGDNLLRYTITAPAGKADNGQTGVSNSGTINAAGGQVIMTARAAADVADAVVNNTGMISATSAKLQNGEVVLDGGDDGDVAVGGTINASGTGNGETGGSVTVTGRNIAVADNTKIDVSGDAGGGTVRIGGDVHGSGTLAHAASVTVGSATITADAIHRGNGGTLVVWSNGLTDFSGIFSAKGGVLGGDGGMIETSGHTLNVGTGAKVDTTAPMGKTGDWLLDPDDIVIGSGEGGSSTPLPPGGTLDLNSDPSQTDYIDPATIVAALATSNVTLEASNYIEVDEPVVYSSSNALNLLSQGDISVYASIQNTQAAGGGAVTLVAGWDGVTAPNAILTTPGAYGNNAGESVSELFLDSYGNDVFVGSASGPTTAAAGLVSLYAENGGNVQLGYHGAGGGDIGVYSTGDVSLTGGSPSQNGTYAMIGNGALDGSVAGAVTGNIFVSAAGTLYLATTSESTCETCSESGGQGQTLGIGNASGIGDAQPTGNVTVVAADINDDNDENGGFGEFIGADLAYGNLTVGRTDTETPLTIDGGGTFDSPHTFTLLSASDIDFNNEIENSGTGAITLVAGWDGHTLDPSLFGTAGVYGNNNGTVNIGGADASGNVAVGTAAGALNVYAANLSLNTDAGNAQLGYHGAGGGDINVTVTGNINGFGNFQNANSVQLGNGTLADDVTGNVTGDINLYSDGQTVFASSVGQSWLGNHAADGFTEAGNVTSLSVTGSYSADYMQADLGTSASTGGNLFIGFHDNADDVGFRIGGIEYASPHDLVFATAGSLDVIGSVINNGTGAVTLVAGWDGVTVGTGVQIRAAGGYGQNGATLNVGGDHSYTIGSGDGAFTFENNQYEDVSVGSAGGLTSILAGDIKIAPAAGYYAQLGYHGSGGGDLVVAAVGDLMMTAGETAHDYAMIGNGSLDGDVTGNITGNLDLHITGSTYLTSDAGSNTAWIGNVAGTGFSETGNVLFTTFDFASADQLGAMMASDLAGGDVTLGVTDMESSSTIADPIVYDSAHTLNLLAAGSLQFVSSLQNTGTGAINVVAGWNGSTLDPAHFGDAGVFGNNNGAVLFGGANAPGNVAVGSAGGATSLYTGTLSIDAVNGYAQAGYHGIGGGAVTVLALGDVSVTADGANFVAQIGNGGSDVGGAVGGAVSVTAGSLELTTSSNSGTAAVGNIAGNNGSEGGDVTVDTHGGALTLTASGQYAHTHIGNWTDGDTAGTSSGNITVNAGAVGLSSTASGAYSQIGNGTFRFGNDTGAMSGNITIHAATFTATAANSQVRVGNLGIGPISGDLSIYTIGDFSLAADVNSLVNIGNVYAGADANRNSLQALATGNLLVQSGGAVTLSAFNGGIARIETGGAASGSVTVNANGNITLNAGTPNSTGSGSFAMIGTLIGGNGGANLSVNSAQGAVSLDASEANSHALIGNLQNGAIGGLLSGTVTVTAANAANGNISLAAGGANAVAHIGNEGDLGETVTGDISVLAGNVLTFGTGDVLVGNSNEDDSGDTPVPAPFTGDVTFNATNVTGNFASSLGNDLAGGDVLVEITGPNAFVQNGLVAYNSSHNLTLLAAGDVLVAGGIQNAGTGAITLLAGWDGATTAPASYGNAGVYGNNGGSITIGGSGAAGNTAVGTAGGATALYANAVSVSGLNGYAQVGYYGAGSGNISVNAKGAVMLSGNADASCAQCYAQIGNGGVFVSGNTAGTIAVNAGGDIILAAGGSAYSYAQIGNGGDSSSGSAAGDISVQTAGSLSLSGAGDYAEIGNGGWGANGDHGGAITVAAAHDVTLTGAQDSSYGYTQIGNGHQASSGADGGSIQVTAGGTLTLTGGGAADYAQIGNGAGDGGMTGDVGGDLDVRAGGMLELDGGGTAGTSWIGNRTASTSAETGNVVVVAADSHGNQDCGLGCFAQADIVGGDVTLAVTSTADQKIDGNILYNSAHTLNLLLGGNIALTGSLQNAGTGAINLVAGWDGHTLTPSSFGTAGVYGNNAKGIVIGGTGAAGNAALGSAGGTTSVYGASLALTAANGYAQLGYNGHGTGAIVVTTTGAISLTGGAATGDFAQIGNGGRLTGGSNGGNIQITAGGALTLAAGAGGEAYAQIGHGGAESNTGANGYSNVAAIAVTAANVLLNAGSGSGAYVQIGNGGYKSGLNLAGGTAGNGGDIAVTSGQNVSLAANGADAYAQIGNGGSQSNLNAAASAGGTDSGDIVVQAPNGSAGAVTLAAGAGANAYAQIGNGGYAVNSGATSTAANWAVTGNVSVTDLSLAGGNAGGNAYSQIGNGDASGSAYGNISGSIVIDANGQITYTNGTAPHSPGTIGNFTGQGTVSGSIDGAQPPSTVAATTNPVVLGNVASNTANNGSNTNNIPVIATVVITVTDTKGVTNTAATIETAAPGPLAALDSNSAESETPSASDGATVVIADSLDGAKKPSATQILMPGMLKQAMPGGGSTVHGVPPADQDFSSWGNEALWQ